MFKQVLIILLITSSLFSADYAVVVNIKSDVKNLSSKQVRDIFIRKRHFVDGVKMVPVNLLSSAKTRAKFEKNVLKIRREKLNQYWIKQHFQGISPPVVQSSNNSMKLFVKNVKGAIGYIPIATLDSGLRVVYEF